MKEFEKFKMYILDKKYFEAHEVLEEVWQKLRKEDNDLKWAYKGLINAAVSLELKKRKRDKMLYIKVWKNFEKYKKYYDIYKNIKDTALFIEKFKPF